MSWIITIKYGNHTFRPGSICSYVFSQRKSNIKWENEAESNNSEGRITMSFVITVISNENDGSIKRVWNSQ